MSSKTLLFLLALIPFVSSQKFREVTGFVGLTQPAVSEQFGGPTIADLDNDGNADIILTFHAKETVRIFHGTGGGRFKRSNFTFTADVHGVSVGPRSANTRERMITISVGGGRGNNLRPPFVYIERPNRSIRGVTTELGLGQVGTRGRVALFMDMSLRGAAGNRRNGGGTDILFINLLGGKDAVLKQFAYQNVKGRYALRRPLGIEKVNEERAIVTDVDGDGIMEVVHFSIFRVFRLTAPFVFRDVTNNIAPTLGNLKRTVAAVVELDFDNDGRMDLYIARANSNLVTPRGPPNVDEFDDVLLLNRGGKYVVAPDSVGALTGTNSMGVSAADFDNDGWVDVVVTTFNGDDFLLKNIKGKRFEKMPLMDVVKPRLSPGHNIVAFDYDNDGRVDFMVSQAWRKAFRGRYRLMRNMMTKSSNTHFLLVRVGNEPTRACASVNGIVIVECGNMKMVRRLGARGAGLGGQSYLETVHFGLGAFKTVDKVTVRWTSGFESVMRNVRANQRLEFGLDL